jgi:hypothetical protein
MMLDPALTGVDLVVHTAGPFQREQKCAVLEAAISTKVEMEACSSLCSIA